MLQLNVQEIEAVEVILNKLLLKVHHSCLTVKNHDYHNVELHTRG